MLRPSPLFVRIAQVLALLPFQAATLAYAGPGIGTSIHHDAVFEPMATLPRYIRVSDGGSCTPFFAGGQGSSFQLEDESGNACVPVFVRDGGGLAEFTGTITVGTCTTDVEVSGDIERSIDVSLEMIFPAASNPGVLAQDLVLTSQIYSEESIFDPTSVGCNGSFGGPGAVIPNSGWSSVTDSSCVAFGSGPIDFSGLVIPPNFDVGPPATPVGATGSYQELVAAATQAFGQIAGFTPVPMLLDVTLDGQNQVTGTSEFFAPLLGDGASPPCALPSEIEYAWTGFFESTGEGDLWGVGGDGSSSTPTDGTSYTLTAHVDPAAADGLGQVNSGAYSVLSADLVIDGTPASVSGGTLWVHDDLGSHDSVSFTGNALYQGVSYSINSSTRVDNSTFDLDDGVAQDPPPVFPSTPTSTISVANSSAPLISIVDATTVAGVLEVGNATTSRDYSIVLRFAQPAGYTPPSLPGLFPIGGGLLVVLLSIAGALALQEKRRG